MARTSLRFWLPLLSAALLVRVLAAFVLFGDLPLVSDARNYAEAAAQLLRGGADAAFFWPPGWPAVLAGPFALFGPSGTVARATAVGLGMLIVVLVVLLAWRVSEEARTAQWAGWIAALYPPLVLNVGVPHAQHLGAVGLLVLALTLLEGWRQRRDAWGLLAGLSFGLLLLTRPSAMALLPLGGLAAVWLLWRRPGYQRLVVLGGLATLLGAGALMAPAVLHNVRHDAGFTISTNNERNFFLGNNPYTPLYKTNHLGQRPLEALPPETRAYLEHVYAQPQPRQAMRDEALDYIVRHPHLTLLRTLNRARAFWGFDYVGARHLQEQRGVSRLEAAAVLAFEGGGYMLFGLLVLVGGVCGWNRMRYKRLLLALVLGYAVPYVLVFSGSLYHFPVVPLLMPTAAVGTQVLVRLESRRQALRSGLLWALAIAFVLVQLEFAFFMLQRAPTSALAPTP